MPLVKIGIVWMIAAAAGCSAASPQRERFGKVYYLDGAGNLGFGTTAVPQGLAQAGFAGDVEVYRWSWTLNPILDQLDRPRIRRQGAALAERIVNYRQENPGRPVHLIGLSAGSGVVLAACENLPPGAWVDNVVLVGASVSYDYDTRNAERRIQGRTYVYYSDNDGVLPWVEHVFGTVDGKNGTKAAGQVGLRPRHGGSRIVNIPRTAAHQRNGWLGGHTDCVKQVFVEREIAPRLIGSRSLASR